MFNRCKTKVNNYWLNLNNYTQAAKHTGSRNSLKQKYHKLVLPYIEHLKPIRGTFKITYTIYRNDNTKFDIGNVGSIVDKYLCDVLTSEGIIPDDNYLYLKEVVFKYGGIGETRADVDIEQLTKEEESSADMHDDLFEELF
jgi:hypothetical protein